MYENISGEQELGFDAFIAPDDFKHDDATQYGGDHPVDIYVKFKEQYVLNNQARYIYSYSDGNFPLTLTPTAGEYYLVGYTTIATGVETLVWVTTDTYPTGTSVFGEVLTNKRWVCVFRVSTAKFILTNSINRAIWYYCGNKVNEIRNDNVYGNKVKQIKYIHFANINSITGNLTNAFRYDAGQLIGRVNIPESVTTLGGGCFDDYYSNTWISAINFPQTKDFYWISGGYNSISARIKEINAGLNNLGRINNASSGIFFSPERTAAYVNLAILTCNEQNPTFSSFPYCDILYSKDKTIIELLAPKTIRGIHLPDELPQAQLDALGTKLSTNLMQNHPLYIGTQITDITNLYLSNKKFSTVSCSDMNTVYMVEDKILYNTAQTQLIKAGTTNTGNLAIKNTVTEIMAGAFNGCVGYTSLTLPPNYNLSMYNFFSFANFGTTTAALQALKTSIENCTSGAVGAEKNFYLNKATLDALNEWDASVVSNAAARFINVGAIVREGLKLWLDASNLSSYPGTGTVWTDLSGNGNNGTLVNGVGFSNGVMVFDGVNDYVTVPFDKTKFGTEFTVQMWIDLSSDLSGRGIWQVANSLNSSSPWILCQSTTTGLRYYLNGTYREGVNSSTWALHTLIYSNSFWYVYLNETLVLTIASPIGSLNGNLLYLGNGYNGFFNGQLNEPLIYNRALTPEEISHNFNTSRSKYGI